MESVISVDREVEQSNETWDVGIASDDGNGMSNFHTVLDSGKVMPAKNVVSTGAKLVKGPKLP
jgi:hypothetical protein